jgi:hypothetical protein
MKGEPDTDGNEWPKYTQYRRVQGNETIRSKGIVWRPKKAQKGILDEWRGHELRVRVGMFGGLCEVFEPAYSSNRKICDLVRIDDDE